MKAHLGRIKLVAVVAGALLAATSMLESMLDLRGPAQRILWTEEQASELQQASVEYKRLIYATPGESGLSPAEIVNQREKAKMRYESLESDLANASERPQWWRHFLLACAVACLGVGMACHFAST